MKRLVLIGLALAFVYFVAKESGFIPAASEVGTTATTPSADEAVAAAFESRRSNVQVHGSGEVAKVLADDNDGSRHQRFIVRLPSGHTVLVAHNIDLARRVAALSSGDPVEFYGEYEWNKKGGVVHWTHRDPQGRHVNGWIKHNGQTYQ